MAQNGRRFRVAAVLLACCGIGQRICAADAEAQDASVHVQALTAVYVPKQASGHEMSVAKLLIDKIKDLYKVELTRKQTAPEPGAPGIFVGRGAAIAAGMISEPELTAVKYDGYVIKAEKNRVALAGYADQGTVYAGYVLLRRLGLKIYPGRNYGNVEVVAPLPQGKLAPFTIATKPFFLYRNLLGWLDRGRWGANFEAGGLGDFRFAHEHPYFKGKGWLGGDHSAPYLVPMAKYYDEHPEYYAEKRGKRIPKKTQNMRVTICMSNPDVYRISAERAIEWMSTLKERRLFHITDGDSSECRCAQCRAMDPVPGSYTDRYLKWVNHVARAVKPKFPDNICMGLAYGGSTQPPVQEGLEANVVILYCPWYWNSRATSAVSWANPLNTTCMEEFMAWNRRFPGQMGLYDYPGAWVQGQAQRLKFLAKQNARYFYSCGGNGDLFQWVNSQLLWDPFLDSEKLAAEFLTAFYGPAAKPMIAYNQRYNDAITQGFKTSRSFLVDPAFFTQARQTLAAIEPYIKTTEGHQRIRVLLGIRELLSTILTHTHPYKARAELRSSPDTYQKDLTQYIRTYEQILQYLESIKNNWLLKTERSGLAKAVSRFGIQMAKDRKTGKKKDAVPDLEAPDKEESVFDRTIASLEDQIKKSGAAQDAGAGTPKRVVLRFDAPDACSQWLVDGSQADLLQPAAMDGVSVGGELQGGVAISAPLTKLPLLDRGKIKIHAGRFYTEKVFDPPLDMTDMRYIDVHLYATAAVPITIYMDDYHSDVMLQPGEQYARVDVQRFRGLKYAEWDKKVKRLSFDIWPQDNYYPYPETQDVDLVFLGLELKNHHPEPKQLPHAGKVIWMTHYRPTIPRRPAVPRELYDKYTQRQKFKHVGMDYYARWKSENFRTFLSHRKVSPIAAILTADTAEAKQAGQVMQDTLGKLYGVTLPLNPEGVTVNANTGNAVILGRSAALASGVIQEEELKYVGNEGFVLRAKNGRIVIAGLNGKGTLFGVARYLEDLGVRFAVPDKHEYAPDLRDQFLYELVVMDRPYFKSRPVPGGARLKTSLPAQNSGDAKAIDVAAAERVAAFIKDLARTGKTEVPPATLKAKGDSPLCRYVAAKLLWDPFDDTTRLIREYRRVVEATD